MTQPDRAVNQNAPQLSQRASTTTGYEPEISGARPRIVVLERGAWVEGFLYPVLEHQRYRLIHVRDADAAVEAIHRETPRLFIASPHYVRVNILDLCAGLRASYPQMSIILWGLFRPDSMEQRICRDLGFLHLQQSDQVMEMLRAIKLIIEDGMHTTDPRLEVMVSENNAELREAVHLWRRRGLRR